MLADSGSASLSQPGQLGTPSPPKPWEGGGSTTVPLPSSTPPSAPVLASPPALPDTTLPYSSTYAGTSPYQQQYGGMINPGSGMYGNTPYSYGSNTGMYGGGGGFGTGYGGGASGSASFADIAGPNPTGAQGFSGLVLVTEFI